MLTDEQKKDIRETISILKQLDYISISLIKNGAAMLKARQELESKEKHTA